MVTDYLETAGLMEPLEKLGFFLVGYGCTTCIGNSGPLASPEVEAAVRQGGPQRGRGAVRQPQLRVAHPSAGQGELPRVAAAGGRLRACGHGEHRPDEGPDRPHQGRKAGDALRALARAGRGQRGRSALRAAGDVQARVREDLRRRRALEDDVRADRPDLPVGRAVHVRPRAAVLRGLRTGAQSAGRHRWGARARGARRLGDDRPHLARGRDPAGQSRRAGTSSSTASSAASSTASARGAATTR